MYRNILLLEKNILRVKLSGVKLPGVKLPGVNLPGVKLPGVKLLEIKLPVTNENRVRLINTIHPILTIFPEEIEKKNRFFQISLYRVNVEEFWKNEKESDTYMKLSIKLFQISMKEKFERVGKRL